MGIRAHLVLVRQVLSKSFGAVSKSKSHPMSIEMATASPEELAKRAEMRHLTSSPTCTDFLARNVVGGRAKSEVL